MKLKFPMLDHEPELQAQLEKAEFTAEVAKRIGQDLLDLYATASPSQEVRMEFLIGEDERGELAIVKYAVALVQKPN
jgi:hypothetical protein